MSEHDDPHAEGGDAVPPAPEAVSEPMPSQARREWITFIEKGGKPRGEQRSA